MKNVSSSTSVRLGTQLVFLFLLAGTAQGQADLGSFNMTAFSPLTISLDNTDWAGSGNPFDVEATATLTHTATGEVRTTGMYYDGNSD